MEKLNLIYFYLVVTLILTVVLPNVGNLLIRRNLGFVLLSNILLEIGKYIALANTLIHEVFHCICAWATGGKAHAISLHHDTSGLATTSTSSRLARILVSYGGYTGSSITAIALFYLLNKGKYEYIIYVFICFAIIGLLVWTKNFIAFLRDSFISLFKFSLYKGNTNLFGLVWSLGFIVILGILIYQNNLQLIQHASIFLSSIVLVESIKTAFVIFVLSIKNRKDAGDATSLAQATFIPAVIWGVVFLGQSIYAGHFIVTHYFI